MLQSLAFELLGGNGKDYNNNDDTNNDYISDFYLIVVNFHYGHMDVIIKMIQTIMTQFQYHHY